MAMKIATRRAQKELLENVSRIPKNKRHEQKIGIDIYKAKINTLPVGGGWVTIVGNPYARRGYRIPPAIRDEGVQHLDMYWAYDEECPWKVAPVIIDLYEEDEERNIKEMILDSAGITDTQLTWMSLHTPSSRHIRMYSGEVRPFTTDLIQDMLGCGYLTIHSFGGDSVIWDEATRDIIGSLQLDGLSFEAAQDELVRANYDFERKMPNFFYRAAGDYRRQFCEEE